MPLSHVKSLFLQVCSIQIQSFEKYSSYQNDKQQEQKRVKLKKCPPPARLAPASFECKRDSLDKMISFYLNIVGPVSTG